MNEATGTLIRQSPTNTPNLKHLTHVSDGLPAPGHTAVTLCGLIKTVSDGANKVRRPRREHCPLCVLAADVKHPGWRA